MFSQTIIIGRLTRARSEQGNESSTVGADLRYANSGRAVISFRVAVDRPGQDDKADYYDVIWWGPHPDNPNTAKFEQHAHYLAKGRLVQVVGRMQNRSYDKADGSKGYVWELHASRVTYLDRPKELPAPPPDDDDVPF